MLSKDNISNNLSYYAQWAFGTLFLLSGLGFFGQSIISGLVTISIGIFLIPKVRNEIMENLGFELPKYAVPVIVFVGLGVAGVFLPSSPSAQFNVVSNNLVLEADNQTQSVVVRGTTEVENIGEKAGSYTVGLYREGEQKENITKTIGPNETVRFDLMYAVTESGSHKAQLRSSTSENLEYSGNGEGEFEVSKTIDVPYVLTESSVSSLVQDVDYGLGAADIETVSNVQILDAGDSKSVLVYNSGGTYWDENDIFKTGVANSYTISRAIFENFDSVDEVVSFTEANSTDQYGNSDSSTAVKISVKRETAGKINWAGIQDRIIGDYKHWLDISDAYKIQYNLCREIELRACSK